MPFQKGQSGNPSGRPKEYPEVVALARKHTPMAISRLATIARGKDAGAAVRAATALLDRGWGKSPETIKLTGADGGPIVLTFVGIEARADAEEG